MRVRIVLYEDVHEWILGKFARRLREQLELQGITSDISKKPDPAADVNHYIIYYNYDGKKSSLDTLMITHVDQEWKLRSLDQNLINVEMGICMSSHTLRTLIKRAIPRKKLCYVNPAHDGHIKPRKMLIGITSRVYPTKCKREHILRHLARSISAADFKFAIMGSGWEDIIETMVSREIEVEYCDHFDSDRYSSLMPTLDYYLYFGQDEGSMGFLDALAAGIPTIVTPQGFHLDAHGGIVYPFNDADELANIFQLIADGRARLTKAVDGWTWSEYARKHVLIWRYLLTRTDSNPLSASEQRELTSLGITRHRTIADMETFAYRALRKARRLAQKAKRRIRSDSPVAP